MSCKHEHTRIVTANASGGWRSMPSGPQRATFCDDCKKIIHKSDGMKRPNAHELQRAVDVFNVRFPVGSDVILLTDTGAVETKVISEAMVLGGHTAVGWFEGVPGCYAIEGRVRSL